MVSFDLTNTRLWWVIASGLLLVSVRYLSLPRLLARVASVVGAASFGIFLTHNIWIKVVRTLTQMLFGPRATPGPIVLFALSLLLGTLTWAAVVAFGRAYRAVQPGQAPEPAQ
jgi:peptidoglycan/LPS O-acetylase OafA/YrhL